jgi:hypothetical protein
MNEKPILFSTPMVNAILEGRKTMTRRAIKPQPPQYADDAEAIARCAGWAKYKVGDILWVRETWSVNEYDDYRYKADVSLADPFHKWEGIRWRPSIFMPREAARIFLKVTDVRVERVQDISERDAVKGGITIMSSVLPDEKTKVEDWRGGTYCTEFKYVWATLNTKRGHGWFANPWVWVIQFEAVK